MRPAGRSPWGLALPVSVGLVGLGPAELWPFGWGLPMAEPREWAWPTGLGLRMRVGSVVLGSVEPWPSGLELPAELGWALGHADLLADRHVG